MVFKSDTVNMWIWNVEHPPLDCPIYELMENIWSYQSHPLEAYNCIIADLDAQSILTLCLFGLFKAFFAQSAKTFVTKHLDDLAFAFKFVVGR